METFKTLQDFVIIGLGDGLLLIDRLSLKDVNTYGKQTELVLVNC